MMVVLACVAWSRWTGLGLIGVWPGAYDINSCLCLTEHAAASERSSSPDLPRRPCCRRLGVFYRLSVVCRSSTGKARHCSLPVDWQSFGVSFEFSDSWPWFWALGQLQPLFRVPTGQGKLEKIKEFEWLGKGQGNIFFGKVMENENWCHQMSDFQAKMKQRSPSPLSCSINDMFHSYYKPWDIVYHF